MNLGLEHCLCRGAKEHFVKGGEVKLIIAVFNYLGGWLYARQLHSLQRYIVKGQGAMVTQIQILT